MSLVSEYLDKTDGPSVAGRNVDVPPMLRHARADKGLKTRILPGVLVVCLVAAVSGVLIFTDSPQTAKAPEPAQTIPVEKAVANTQPVESKPVPATQTKVSPVTEPIKPEQPGPQPLAKAPVPAAPPVQAVAPEVQQTVLDKVALKTVRQKQNATPVPPVAAKPALASVEKKPEPGKAAIDPTPQIQPVAAVQKTTRQPRQILEEPAQVQAPEKVEEPVVVNVKPKVVAADPKHYFALGVTAQKDKQDTRAIDYYRKALALDPSYAPALLNLATIHIKRGNQARAMTILEKLQATSPGNPEVVFNLGTLYIQQKKYEKASVLLEGFTALGNSHPGILFNLAYLNQLLNNPDKALEYYNQVLTLVPGHTKACLAAASVCEKQQQIERALAYYNRALTIVDKQGLTSLNLKIKNRIRLLQRIGADLNRDPGRKT